MSICGDISQRDCCNILNESFRTASSLVPLTETVRSFPTRGLEQVLSENTVIELSAIQTQQDKDKEYFVFIHMVHCSAFAIIKTWVSFAE